MTQRLLGSRLFGSIAWSVCAIFLSDGIASAQAIRPAPRQSTGPQADARPSGGAPSSIPRKSVPTQTAPVAGNAGQEAPATGRPGPRPAPLASANDTSKLQVQPVSPDMLALLDEWEQKTAGFTSMEARIYRREYDHVFYSETRSEGRLYYQNPDRGRIDFDAASEAFMAKPSTKLHPETEKPYRVVNADATRWISTGEYIFILDVGPKQYRQIEIPPASRGKNITRSPLPFLFGMKADDALARFHLTFGQFHDPANKNKRGAIVNVVAYPTDRNVAQEYARAEVIMDANTFLPIHLRTLDPAGNKETVYQFHQVELGATWLTNPFKVPVFGGWEKLSDTKAAAEAPAVPPRRATTAPQMR